MQCSLFKLFTKNDDILKVRLDMRDNRFNSKKKDTDGMRLTDVEAETVDVEMQIDEAEVAGELFES